MITTSSEKTRRFRSPVSYFQFLSINLGETVFFPQFVSFGFTLLCKPFLVSLRQGKFSLFFIFKITDNLREINLLVNGRIRITDVVCSRVFYSLQVFRAERF